MKGDGNCRIVSIEDNRERFLPLLLLADPSEEVVRSYLKEGMLHVLYDGEERPVCEALILDLGFGVCEVKNLATGEDFQNRGYASVLLEYLFLHYGASFTEMRVGTSPGVVAFYQRLGFVVSHIIPNFFLNLYEEPIWENGYRLTDMIYLKKDLKRNE